MSLAKCLKKLKIDSSHEDSIISGLASLTEQGNLEGYRKASLALDQAMNDTLDEQEDLHTQLEKQGYSFKEDNSLRDSKLLEEKLNKQGHTFTITPKNVRDFVAKDKTRETQATTATNLASKFGKRITWIDAKGDFGINGVVVPNIKDVIFLDVNTKYPAHAVMGHELSHHLEYDKPEVYKNLVTSMEGLLKNHKEYAEKYKIEGVSHKDIVKEMIGDIMGDNFTKQDFWNKLADQDRSLFTKIADTIKAWLEQFIKSNNLGSDAFVNDAKKAREVLALAIAQYKEKGETTSPNESKSKFSKSPAEIKEMPGYENGAVPSWDKSGFIPREMVKAISEWFSGRLTAEGIGHELTHSGSAAGASSYIRINNLKDEVRISGHSKGVFNSQFYAQPRTPNEFDEILKLAQEANPKYSDSEKQAIKDRQKDEEMRVMYPIRLKSADKKLAKGKALTRSEQEAVDWRSAQQPEFLKEKPTSKFSRTMPYTAKEPLTSNVSLEDLKAHPKYQEAKHGSLDSAISLVNDLISKEDVIKANSAFGNDVIYVPVTQFEKDGINRIPYAIAQKYASETGASINDSLYVKDKAFHTGMKMMERLIARTRFEGDVPKGKYVLVDDVTSSGATLADLSSYIQEQGGDVVGSVLLTNAMRGDKIIADKSLTKLLETKYGNEIRELFGIEPSSLTREEAKYLQGFRTSDELRASANKASTSRAERIRIKALPKSEDAKFSREELKDTININGTERLTTNSEGKPIYPTEEGVRSFWKWFGDSKVVDDQGRPLVVYHGTSKDITVFNPDEGKGKTYGTGSFFSSNPDTSATYTGGVNGGNIMPVYLRMEKPAVLDAQGANWNRLNKNTRITLPEVTVSAQTDEDLLAELYDSTPDQGTTRKLKARNTTLGRLLPDDFRYVDDYGSTDDIARWARQKGYDGLIIHNVVDQGPTGNFANEKSSEPSTIYVAYDANQVKSATGNNGDYSKSNNDIRFSKEAIPKETTYQKSQRTVQDKFNRFSVIRDWLKERGVKLTELSNVYDAEERYHAKVANQLEDFREKVRNPLVEKIAKAGFTLSDVQDYLLAQHASEANKQIQKVRNDSEALAYGITDEEASEYLSKAKPELATLANELRDVTEQAKQLRLDAGILNKDITDNWDNTYKHYIPVKGDESIQGTGKGLNVNHKDKRRLGHEKRNEAVIENILMDYERAVMEVEKNRVGKYLVMFAAEANNPDLITVGQPEKRNILKENNSYAIVDSDGVIHSVYVNKIDAQRNAPKGSSIQKISDPRVISQASPVLAPNEVNVYMDGHAIRVQLNDDLLARAYANMGVESVGAIVEAGRVLNSYLSKVYTGYNPEFIVTNIIRDFTSGIVNLTGEEGTLMAVKAIGNYPKMFADLFRYAVTRKSTELIDSYRANGGNTGAAYLSDMERLGKEISSEYASYQGVIANIKAGDGANAFRAAGRKVFNSTLKWIEHLNQAGENAMRLSAYKAMLDSGKTVEQASKVAKNITVNFNRRGEIGQTANALYLFFNASVQGSAAVLHANLKGNHKYQANALAVGMASLGYMLAAGLGGMDEEEYDKIDDTTKERNLIIGSEGSYVKIPIPYGYGFFFNTGRVIADAQRKGEFGKAPFRMAVNAVEELTPFGNLVNSDEINSEQVVGGVAPTALQIPYQMSTNTSLFTGKEIRPVSPFDNSQPEREQMFRNTKGTVYDDMAGLLSNAGFDVSPENIKFLTRTLTGGAGALVDTAVSSSKLKAQGAELDIKEMPFVRKFSGENTISNDRSAYYKAVEEAKKAAEEFSRAKKNNDVSSMKKIMEDKRELLAMDKYANKLRKVIKLSRDKQDAVRLNEDIPIAEKRLKLKELEAQEAKLYDNYLDVYKARVK